MKNVFYLSHSQGEVPRYTPRLDMERNGTEWNAMLHSAQRVGRLRIAKAAAAKAQEQDDKRVDHLSKNTSDQPKYMTHTGLASVEVPK